MPTPKSYLSHIVMQCFDFERMLDFYTGVLGFHSSDVGEARGQRMAFLTLDPSLEHHQLALATGRKGDSGSLHHVAFGVHSLKELNERLEHLRKHDVQGIELWTHASMLSVYYRDPEDNRMEFFMETPYYVSQPIAETLDVDISQDDATVWKAIEDKYGSDPSFQLMSEWKKNAVRTREESKA